MSHWQCWAVLKGLPTSAEMLLLLVRSGALLNHCRSCRRCSSAARFGNALAGGRSLVQVVEMEYLVQSVLKAPALRESHSNQSYRASAKIDLAGKTWTSGNCNDCEGWRTALWVRGSVVQEETPESREAYASMRQRPY